MSSSPARSGSVEKVPLDRHSENKDVESSAPSHDANWEKRTMRRIDLKLLPILSILYSISLIDRVNISAAYISGMAIDLQLAVGSRYSLAVVMFFVPYIILELPANLVVRRVGAALWLGSICTAWGVVMLGMAFLTRWWELVICRALLGALEAGFFPACAYIISCWYVRVEIQKRMTGFYVLSICVGGFASAIAGGISEMAGLRGLNGWQWIFLLMGVATIVAGLAGYFVIQDFPDKNKFLTEEQTAWVLNRIKADRADTEFDAFTWPKFFAYCKDLRLWAYMVLFGSATTTAYAFAYFLPIILKQGMGYSTRDANLLLAPPHFFAAIVAFALAALGDKVRLRGPFIAVQSIITIIGLCMIAFTTGNASRYSGVFIGLVGCSANVPGVLGYQQNNIRGYSKRAFGSALAIGGGGIGGIIASTVFRSQDAPTYRPGLWVCIGGQLLSIVVVGLMSAHAYIRNKQVRNGTIKKPIEGQEGFLYTY